MEGIATVEGCDWPPRTADSCDWLIRSLVSVDHGLVEKEIIPTYTILGQFMQNWLGHLAQPILPPFFTWPSLRPDLQRDIDACFGPLTSEEGTIGYVELAP